MIVKRKITQTVLGNSDVLHRVVLESDDCAEFGEKTQLIKLNMLKQIVNDPHLAYCDTFDFEILTMKYYQGKWIIETKYTEKRSENQSL